MTLNLWTLGAISSLIWFVGASGLVALRLAYESELSQRWRERLATIAALATVLGCIATTIVLIERQSFDFAGMPAFARGALGGAILVMFAEGLAFGLVFSYSWALRHPNESPRIGTVLLEKGLLVLVGAVGFGAVITVTEAEPTGAALTLILVAFYVFLFTGSSLVVPWLTMLAGSRRLEQMSGGEALQAWADKKMNERDMKPVPIRVLHGTVCNAFVLWKPGRPFFLVGAQLLGDLPESEVRAVLAHEIGHLLRRDAVMLVWLGLSTALLSALLTQWVILPLIAGGQPVIGALVVGVVNGTLVTAAGLYMRRMELRTDRIAVEVMDGRWKPLAKALTRIAGIKQTPLHRRSLTHPSVNDRIAAMQRHHDHGVYDG